MNFIAAKVARLDGSQVLLEVPGVGQVALPGDTSGFTVGGDATIGIRPEAITTTAPDEPALGLSVTPRTIERLGLHTIVYAEQGGRPLTCLFNGDPSIGADTPLGVHVPMTQIHLFDPAGIARGRRD
jgi:multiple sugar transport system ATP-binding protein